MSNEQNSNQNTEILETLKLVLTEVKTISVDLQTVKTTVDILNTNQQALAVDVQDIKLRTASTENHLVYFGTRLQNLEETVAQRLHDTRPIWQSVLERLDSIEKSLETLKGDVEVLKTDVATLKADMILVKADVATLKQTEAELKKDLQEFKDTVLEGFVGVQKDINFYHKKSQMDYISFVRDLASFERRLERVENKLEIKN